MSVWIMDVYVKLSDSRSNGVRDIRAAAIVSNERTNMIGGYPSSAKRVIFIETLSKKSLLIMHQRQSEIPGLPFAFGLGFFDKLMFRKEFYR